MKKFGFYGLYFLGWWFLVNPALSADVYIYSASSIAPSLEIITQSHGGDKVHIVAGSSAALAAQIKRGARADIFISAHPKWTARVISLKTRRLVSNRLVLAALRRSPLAPDSLDRIIKSLTTADKRLALTDSIVPAGFYSKQALEYYALWSEALALAVFGSSAQTTLSWVKSGAVEAGIIYASDLHQHPQLKLLARLPAISHEPIHYRMAQLNDRAETKALWRFLERRTTDLRRFGFTP